jgi:ketosteroid isomerase-like protein
MKGAPLAGVDVVHRFYQAVDRSDVVAALDCLADNVVWRGPSPLVPAGRVHLGLDDVRSRWLGDFLAAYPEYWAKPTEFVASDGLVIAIGEHGALINGVSTAMPMVQIWRVHGAKVVGARFFTDTAGLLEALSRPLDP